ncbi:lipid II flippase MurJ [Oerskovia sp. M15]
MITAVTIASRLVGFARTLVMATTVGTPGIGAAYTSANILPNVLFEVAAGGALAGAVVPLLAGPIARGARVDVSKIASALLGWTLLVLVPLGALLAVLAYPIAHLLMAAKHPELVDVTALFVRVFALQIPMYGFAVILGGILQAHKRFFWQAFAPLVSSVVVIAVYLIFAGMADGNQADVAALSTSAIAWLGWGRPSGSLLLRCPWSSLSPARGPGCARPCASPVGGRPARNLAFAGVGRSSRSRCRCSRRCTRPTTSVPRRRSRRTSTRSRSTCCRTRCSRSRSQRARSPPCRARRPGSHELFNRLLASTTRTILLVSGVGVAALVAAAAAVEAVFAVVTDGSVEGLASPLPPWPRHRRLRARPAPVPALYVLDRQRAAVVATASGWVVVALLAVVGPATLGEGDQVRVLALLGLATAVGMTVAGLLLLLAVRRHAGPTAVHGVPRTLVVLVVGVMLGSAAGAV